MKTPEQEIELEAHKFVFGISFFNKKENRVMHPNTIRFVKDENIILERNQWVDGTTHVPIFKHKLEDVEVIKIEGYDNLNDSK